MVQPWRSLSLFPFPFVNPADGHFIVSHYNSHTSPEPTPGKQIKEKGKKLNRCEERRKTFQPFSDNLRQFQFCLVRIRWVLTISELSNHLWHVFCLRLKTDLFRHSQTGPGYVLYSIDLYSTYSVNNLVPVYALFHMFIHTISDKIRPLQAVLCIFSIKPMFKPFYNYSNCSELFWQWHNYSDCFKPFQTLSNLFIPCRTCSDHFRPVQTCSTVFRFFQERSGLFGPVQT